MRMMHKGDAVAYLLTGTDGGRPAKSKGRPGALEPRTACRIDGF